VKIFYTQVQSKQAFYLKFNFDSPGVFWIYYIRLTLINIWQAVSSTRVRRNSSRSGFIYMHFMWSIPQRYQFWSLFTLTTSGIFPFPPARQPQGPLPHRPPPLKPCANEFSLPFSYTKTLARSWNTTREKKWHLHKVWMVGNDPGGRPDAVQPEKTRKPQN
jgi:hypothetical protein